MDSSRLSALRRHALVLTAGVAMFGLAACGGTSTPSGSSSAGSKTALNVAVLSNPTFTPCAQAAAKNFTTATGIKVNLVALPYQSMLTKYLADANAGVNDYDLVNLPWNWVQQLVSAGYLANISSEAQPDSNFAGLDPNDIKAYQYQGKTYAVPYLGDAMMLWYRTDIFKALNLTPPTTWAQYNADEAKIQAAPQYKGVYPTAIMGDVSQVMASWQSRYYGLGGTSLQTATGGATVNKAAAIAALIQEKHDISLSPPGALSASYPEVSAEFMSGKAAMTELFASAPGNTFSTPGPGNNIVGKFATALVPGGHADLGGWGFGVTSSSKNQANAYKFASFMATPKEDLMCALNYAKVPVQKANENNAQFLQKYPALKTVAPAVAGAIGRFGDVNQGNQNNTVAQYVAEYLSGQIKNPATDIDEMIAALNQDSK